MNLQVRTTVVGNLTTFGIDGRHVERIGVRSDDMAKRVLRFVTAAGEIGLRFEGGARLCDGDVIFADDERVIAVNVDPDDVLIFRPLSLAAGISLGHALGNRHISMQLDGAAVVVRYDPLLEALAIAGETTVVREQRVVAAPFRHAHAPHAHG